MLDPVLIFLTDDGVFPNSSLPVLYYNHVIMKERNNISLAFVELFNGYNWTNHWIGGIQTVHHYHSNTHEVLGVIKGNTTLMLGGDSGQRLDIQQGDVLVIPAGVAHRNLGSEDDVMCVGAYPAGRGYDMNYGNSGERPLVDRNIGSAQIPNTDPVYGLDGGLVKIWPHYFSFNQ